LQQVNSLFARLRTGTLKPHKVSAGIQNDKKVFVFVNELGQLLLPSLHTVLSGFSML